MPIHPILVHFPIAFCVLEIFFLILWRFKKDPAYLRVARIVFLLAFLGIPAAMAAGLYDAGGLKGVHGEVREHAIAALGFFTVYVVRAFLWRWIKKESPAQRLVFLGGAVAGLVLVTVTGYHGGKLVYSHG